MHYYCHNPTLKPSFVGTLASFSSEEKNISYKVPFFVILIIYQAIQYIFISAIHPKMSQWWKETRKMSNIIQWQVFCSVSTFYCDDDHHHNTFTLQPGSLCGGGDNKKIIKNRYPSFYTFLCALVCRVIAV